MGLHSIYGPHRKCLIGAALSMGANIDIMDMPGYAPLVNDMNMIELAKDATRKLLYS